jgi:hypothetical protein
MFYIQHSCPSIIKSTKNQFAELNEAIQHVFPMDTEMAFLFWNGHYIAMSYKYDISVCIDDIILCLDKINSGKSEKIFLTFGSDTFNAIWEINCNNGSLYITAQWDYVRGLEKYIDNKTTIKTTSQDFTSEWIGILQIIDQALIKNNITLSDEQHLIVKMREIIASNNVKGEIYRN